jgi:hypothetical protein
MAAISDRPKDLAPATSKAEEEGMDLVKDHLADILKRDADSITTFSKIEFGTEDDRWIDKMHQPKYTTRWRRLTSPSTSARRRTSAYPSTE